MRCGQCEPCLTENNCGVCSNCLDKREFGGKNIKKQACKLRKCANPIMPIVVPSALRDAAMAAGPQREPSDPAGPRMKKKTLKFELIEAAKREESEERRRQQIQREEARLQRAASRATDSAAKREIQAAARELKRLKKLSEVRRPSVDDSTPKEKQKQRKQASSASSSQQDKTDAKSTLESLPTQVTTTAQRGQSRVMPHTRDNMTVQEACADGYAVATARPLTEPMCYLCGTGRTGSTAVDCGNSTGTMMDELRFCEACCEPMHSFCFVAALGDAHVELPDLRPWSDASVPFFCSRCRTCVVCSRAASASSTGTLLDCSRCRRLHHPTCLPPQHPTKPCRRNDDNWFTPPSSSSAKDGGDDSSPSSPPSWLCPRCIMCTSCGAVSAAWSPDPLTCLVCHRRRINGHFCTICDRTYPDDDFSLAMVFCMDCKRWIHASCQRLTNEQYQILGELPEDSVTFVCSACQPNADGVTPEWVTAVLEETTAGLQKVFAALKTSLSKCKDAERPYWPPAGLNENNLDALTAMMEDDDDDAAAMATGPSNGGVHRSFDRLLRRICVRVDRNDYATVGEFHHDILAFLEVLGKQPRSFEHVALLRSGFSRTMRKLFPWYEVNKPPVPDGGRDVEGPPVIVRRTSTTSDPALSFPQPGGDHSYARRVASSSATATSSVSDAGDVFVSDPSVPSVATGTLNVASTSSAVADPAGVGTSDAVCLNEPRDDSATHTAQSNNNSSSSPPGTSSSVLSGGTSVMVTGSVSSNTATTTVSAASTTTAVTTHRQSARQLIAFESAEEDKRQCGFCGGCSDDITNTSSSSNSITTATSNSASGAAGNRSSESQDRGRLMMCTSDEWVHFNCALWSSEVYEREDGTLMQVQAAMMRSRHLRCEVCDSSGASVGCCHGRCPKSFHYLCARRNGCTFLANKNVFCREHGSSAKSKLALVESHFKLDRRLVVDLGKLRAMRRYQFGMLPSEVRLSVGGLRVLQLGDIKAASDRASYLLPVGFRSQRVFWSVESPDRLCVYTCTIVEELWPEEEEAADASGLHAENSLAVAHSVIDHDADDSATHSPVVSHSSSSTHNTTTAAAATEHNSERVDTSADSCSALPVLAGELLFEQQQQEQCLPLVNCQQVEALMDVSESVMEVEQHGDEHRQQCSTDNHLDASEVAMDLSDSIVFEMSNAMDVTSDTSVSQADDASTYPSVTLPDAAAKIATTPAPAAGIVSATAPTTAAVTAT
eukprot:scpid31430/ scgid17891/ Histone-lysine N-methyltransferase MLL; ALL-1; CXXC-type zinc finger protein 7; Lysine N-methyltransferase 2A; Trithorax-like protein; Zinc finger protein HRX; MLL cleavage product N320; N-terminal cleavage product of 320 kDa; MLL cleavage product C180; C-terminal cleavage product of 180 kDa